jgi:transcriptional regulator with XRE-family HTH domain
MDAFERILSGASNETKRQVDKNLAIANRISEILVSKDISQREFAKKLNKSESEISKWLTGFHNFEVKTTYKIESVLGEEVIMIIDSTHEAA